MDVDLAEEVVVDLRGGLAAADEGDRVLLLELLLVVQIAGVVDRVAAEAPDGLGDVRRSAGAEDEARRAVRLAALGAHDVHLGGLVVRDLRDGRAEADAGEFRGGPAAVVVVLGPQGIEVLADVEGVQPPRFLEVVQEGVRGGRVGERDQVRHERGLEVGAFEEHPRVPFEVRLGLQEDTVQFGYRFGEGGQAEVEGAEADPDEVEGIRGLRKLRQGSLPGTARRGRRSDRGPRRCRRRWSRG